MINKLALRCMSLFAAARRERLCKREFVIIFIFCRCFTIHELTRRDLRALEGQMAWHLAWYANVRTYDTDPRTLALLSWRGCQWIGLGRFQVRLYYIIIFLIQSESDLFKFGLKNHDSYTIRPGHRSTRLNPCKIIN
jgi:hypothetical protein